MGNRLTKARSLPTLFETPSGSKQNSFKRISSKRFGLRRKPTPSKPRANYTSRAISPNLSAGHRPLALFASSSSTTPEHRAISIQSSPSARPTKQRTRNNSVICICPSAPSDSIDPAEESGVYAPAGPTPTNPSVPLGNSSPRPVRVPMKISGRRRSEAFVAAVHGRIKDIPQLWPVATAGLTQSIAQRRIMRRPSDFTDLQHYRYASEGVKLTLSEQMLVKNAFPTETKVIAASCDWVFNYLRKKEPQINLMFSTYFNSQNLTMGKRRDAWLRSHKEKTAQVLEMVIASLDSLEDSLGSFLTAVGANHAQLLQRCLPATAWDLLAHAFIESASVHWRFRTSRLETLCAWRKIVFFMIDKVRLGYDAEVADDLLPRHKKTP